MILCPFFDLLSVEFDKIYCRLIGSISKMKEDINSEVSPDEVYSTKGHRNVNLPKNSSQTQNERAERDSSLSMNHGPSAYHKNQYNCRMSDEGSIGVSQYPPKYYPEKEPTYSSPRETIQQQGDEDLLESIDENCFDHDISEENHPPHLKGEYAEQVSGILGEEYDLDFSHLKSSKRKKTQNLRHQFQEENESNYSSREGYQGRSAEITDQSYEPVHESVMMDYSHQNQPQRRENPGRHGIRLREGLSDCGSDLSEDELHVSIPRDKFDQRVERRLPQAWRTYDDHRSYQNRQNQNSSFPHPKDLNFVLGKEGRAKNQFMVEDITPQPSLNKHSSASDGVKEFNQTEKENYFNRFKIENYKNQSGRVNQTIWGGSNSREKKTFLDFTPTRPIDRHDDRTIPQFKYNLEVNERLIKTSDDRSEMPYHQKGGWGLTQSELIGSTQNRNNLQKSDGESNTFANLLKKVTEEKSTAKKYSGTEKSSFKAEPVMSRRRAKNNVDGVTRNPRTPGKNQNHLKGQIRSGFEHQVNVLTYQTSASNKKSQVASSVHKRGVLGENQQSTQRNHPNLLEPRQNDFANPHQQLNFIESSEPSIISSRRHELDSYCRSQTDFSIPTSRIVSLKEKIQKMILDVSNDVTSPSIPCREAHNLNKGTEALQSSAHMNPPYNSQEVAGESERRGIQIEPPTNHPLVVDIRRASEFSFQDEKNQISVTEALNFNRQAAVSNQNQIKISIADGNEHSVAHQSRSRAYEQAGVGGGYGHSMSIEHPSNGKKNKFYLPTDEEMRDYPEADPKLVTKIVESNKVFESHLDQAPALNGLFSNKTNSRVMMPQRDARDHPQDAPDSYKINNVSIAKVKKRDSIFQVKNVVKRKSKYPNQVEDPGDQPSSHRLSTNRNALIRAERGYKRTMAANNSNFGHSYQGSGIIKEIDYLTPSSINSGHAACSNTYNYSLTAYSQDRSLNNLDKSIEKNFQKNKGICMINTQRTGTGRNSQRHLAENISSRSKFLETGREPPKSSKRVGKELTIQPNVFTIAIHNGPFNYDVESKENKDLSKRDRSGDKSCSGLSRKGGSGTPPLSSSQRGSRNKVGKNRTKNAKKGIFEVQDMNREMEKNRNDYFRFQGLDGQESMLSSNKSKFSSSASNFQSNKLNMRRNMIKKSKSKFERHLAIPNNQDRGSFVDYGQGKEFDQIPENEDENTHSLNTVDLVAPLSDQSSNFRFVDHPGPKNQPIRSRKQTSDFGEINSYIDLQSFQREEESKHMHLQAQNTAQPKIQFIHPSDFEKIVRMSQNSSLLNSRKASHYFQTSAGSKAVSFKQGGGIQTPQILSSTTTASSGISLRGGTKIEPILLMPFPYITASQSQSKDHQMHHNMMAATLNGHQMGSQNYAQSGGQGSSQVAFQAQPIPGLKIQDLGVGTLLKMGIIQQPGNQQGGPVGENHEAQWSSSGRKRDRPGQTIDGDGAEEEYKHSREDVFEQKNYNTETSKTEPESSARSTHRVNQKNGFNQLTGPPGNFKIEEIEVTKTEENFRKNSSKWSHKKEKMRVCRSSPSKEATQFENSRIQAKMLSSEEDEKNRFESEKEGFGAKENFQKLENSASNYNTATERLHDDYLSATSASNKNDILLTKESQSREQAGNFMEIDETFIKTKNFSKKKAIKFDIFGTNLQDFGTTLSPLVTIDEDKALISVREAYLRRQKSQESSSRRESRRRKKEAKPDHLGLLESAEETITTNRSNRSASDRSQAVLSKSPRSKRSKSTLKK